MQTWTAILESVHQETSIDRTLVLHVPSAPPQALAYTPGQFVVLSDPEGDARLRRAYSLSSADQQDGRLRITVRDMGDFGATLYAAKPEREFVVRAPQGRFVLDAATPQPVLMVAGGSGVTPFHAFVQVLSALPAPPPFALLQSGRVASELPFHEAFQAAAAACPAFTYIPSVTRARADDPWTGRRGRVDEELCRSVLQEGAQFYACGLPAFVRAMGEVAEALGIPKERRHREQW